MLTASTGQFNEQHSMTTNNYQALARRFRPRNFQDYVGQTHAIQALKNALDQQKIHHAYLFTGTRGVGKTSLARLFAKALSCKQGVSSTPCETCSACTAINQGRYLDLIEIDAASRTKVEDTRELLTQVDYPATEGKYKIYIIDEAHMLSTHSFNALLKTLEEPPEHVKFILATTDPNKLPITIQSRCLQFHLQHFSEATIAKRLEHVLDNIQFQYDPEAIKPIARAAHGSLRDGLSLLEQTLGLCQDNTLSKDQVMHMLGTLPELELIKLFMAIQAEDKPSISHFLEHIKSQSYPYGNIMDQCLTLLYDITQLHIMDNATKPELTELAQCITPGETQMAIEMILHAKKNLDLFPNQHMAFSLLVMRLLAFEYEPPQLSASSGPNNQTQSSPHQGHLQPSQAIQAASKASSNTATSTPKKQPQDLQPTPPKSTSTTVSTASAPPASDTVKPRSNQIEIGNDWQQLVQALPLQGLSKQIISHTQCPHPLTDSTWKVSVPAHLFALLNPAMQEKICKAIHAQHASNPTIQFILQQESPTEKENPITTPTNPASTVPARIQPNPKSSQKTDFKPNKTLKSLADQLQAEIVDV